MAHRSNQAVASQEQPAPQAPEDPPRPRRVLIGWTTALAALGISTAALGLAVWLLRFPIAAFFLSSALADRGAEADFRFVNLDLTSAVLTGVRFGSETAPDASADRVEVRWAWSGLAPQLRSLKVQRPVVRLRVDQAGRISAGSLDRIGGGGGRARPSIPAIAVTLEDGRFLIDAPFGALEAPFHGAGTLGTDFSGVARLAETSRTGARHTLDGGAAELVVVSRDNTVALRLTANARRLRWLSTTLDTPQLQVMARAPLDLARYDVEAAWRLEGLRAPDISAQTLSGAAGAEGVARDDSIEPQTWQAQARVNAGDFSFASNAIQRMRFDARIDGRDTTGDIRWTLSGERFEGLSLISERPSANGALTLDLRGDERLSGEAHVSLAQARLNESAQRSVRDAFPNLTDAPVGPTFAHAEAALDRAADRFDLTLPLRIDVDEQHTRVRLVSPAEARAASGARLTLAPLRQDAPALTVEFPGSVVNGAVALELQGGGAPEASLLLDTVEWQPRAPFEADGTLTLENWRAEGASIATNELAVSISAPPAGAGRLDLRGPVRITGPLGDGKVRDLVAALDVSVSWRPGWRVTPNHGCLPVTLGGLDAAGLSFAGGGFGLCALNGALIAADAGGNLSGGFVIQRLALNGRMGGPEGQPARLSATNVAARFSGRTGAMTISLEADAPALSINMSPERTLAVQLARMTAAAHVGETWNVDGQFERGSLTDPTLPGSVSAIGGQWSAAPEDGAPVIRIDAAEALLTANRPDTEAERPLFNPLRLTAVQGLLREGAITANGNIVLEGRGSQLAQFTAEHSIEGGTGAAHVIAPEIVFGADMQPYDITERARGLVDNVRGPAAVNAEIAWTREAITSTGRVTLNGVSLATSTIPIVEDVRGDVNFNDLFLLTTPPSQHLTVGSLNPGVAVQNGSVFFQLLPEERVSIERADFDFAGGTLSMSPTAITLGADETAFELTLHDVDAGNLIDALNLQDISATGRIEGTFPLVLTRQSALIQHGELHTLPGGGTISYTGAAGESATGMSRIAFDALRSFRYERLSLTLDGDLSGDVVSSIDFSGHNSGRAVDLGPIMSLPGVGRVTVRGVPFDFNVRVTAPFRSLARTAASITDPGIIINQRDLAPQEQEPVDPDTPGTR